MDDRIVEFIQALRAAGVRVSLAESEDSMRAIEQLGIMDRELFKSALRTTLVKEHADFPTFEQIFPIFFQIGPPPMQQPGGNGLSEEQQAQLDAAMQQLMEQLGQKLAKQMAEEMKHDPIKDLTNRPIDQLSPREIDQLRDEVRRMAARLRTRAALRNRRHRSGSLDAKATIRHSQRYGGVPVELKFRRKRLKPKLTVICDISTSMRPHASFMLTLMYELQDIVARTRSFAFIDDMHDITADFTEKRPHVAIAEVLQRIPPGYYSTDLGASLSTFCRDHLDAVDRRTTVIMLGDGRNNYNDPRLDCIVTLKRHARRVLWFTPEDRHMWGTGDSDMFRYAPLMDQVHYVSTLRQLADAIDRMLGG